MSGKTTLVHGSRGNPAGALDAAPRRRRPLALDAKTIAKLKSLGVDASALEKDGSLDDTPANDALEKVQNYLQQRLAPSDVGEAVALLQQLINFDHDESSRKGR